MEHEEFIERYKADKIEISVDRNRAMHVCDDPKLMPKNYRFAHHFWKWASLLLIFGGFISFFWLPWWAATLLLFLGFIMTPAVQKSAGQFVVEQALERPDFFELMVLKEVITVRRK